MKPSSIAYHFYQKLRKAEKNWKETTEGFCSRYNIKNKEKATCEKCKEFKIHQLEEKI